MTSNHITGSLLMGRKFSILAFLLLALTCLAQTNGKLPVMIDGSDAHLEMISCGFNCIFTPDNLVIGDLIFVGATQSDAVVCLAGSNTWNFNSSSGNAFTKLTGHSTTINGANNKVFAQLAYSVVTVAGADQFTITGGYNAGCSNSMVYGRVTHFSGSVDGSVQTCLVSGGGTPTCSSSHTTANNGDIIVGLGSSNTASGFANPFPTGGTVNAGAADYADNNGGNSYLGLVNAGAAGTNTFPLGITGGNGSQELLIQSIAFKPDITITTTAIPDVISGSAYDVPIGCIGGTTTLSWSETGSLPSGLSFSTSTGHLSGTASGAGSFSIVVACTDGTLTSPNQTLTFKVGTAQGTPTLEQSKLWNANNGGSSTTITGVHCGSMLLVLPLGIDSGGGMIGVHNPNGANNNFRDNLGDPVQRIQGVGSNIRGAFPAMAIGPVSAAGSITVTAVNNLNSSSGLPPILLEEIQNAQSVIGPDIFNTEMVFSNGSNTIAASYTTVTPNTMLIASTATSHNSDIMSIASPFSLIAADNTDTYNSNMYYSDLAVSPATVTATSSVNTPGFNNTWVTNIVGLLPRLPSAACGEVVAQGRNHGQTF